MSLLGVFGRSRLPRPSSNSNQRCRSLLYATMNTPKRETSQPAQPVQRVSAEQKEQMLENLDIEGECSGRPSEGRTLNLRFYPHFELSVTNNRRRFEAYLEQVMEAFTVRHEWEITRIPRNVRKMTIKQFMANGGTIQACAQALAKQRMAENEDGGLARKRCVVSQERNNMLPILMFSVVENGRRRSLRLTTRSDL